MGNTYLRQSPLAHLHLYSRTEDMPCEERTTVNLGERQLLGMINLRGCAQEPAFTAAVRKSLSVELPRRVNTVTGKPAGTHILCLGPDEWLVVTKSGEEIKLHNELSRSLAKLHTAITLIGEGYTTIRISGTHARETLAKGCSLDLHPCSFTPGKCAQTTLGRAEMTLHQITEDNESRAATYDIIVSRSFAEYIWTWLEDAAQEYGVRVVSTFR